MLPSIVLVTGATGFVGSHLVERLLAAGRRVRCLVRETSSLKYLKGARVELAYGDAATGLGLEAAVAGVDVVFHVAGVTKALAPGDYYIGNVTATSHVLSACERVGGRELRFVHVSSLAAVGPSPDGRPVAEDVSPAPLTHYGASKLESEIRVRHSELAARAVIVRPPVVYGDRDTDVLHVFRAVRRGLMVRIGRQESWFSLVHVRDLAEGLFLAATCEGAAGQTYFVSNPEPVSWSEFAHTAASLMQRKLRILPLPYRVARVAGWLAEFQARRSGRPGILSRDKIAEARCRYWTCNPSRARAELGFEARIPLSEGIRETLAWYREAGWLSY